MDRSLPAAVLLVATLSGGSLVGAALWDAWHYRWSAPEPGTPSASPPEDRSPAPQRFTAGFIPAPATSGSSPSPAAREDHAQPPMQTGTTVPQPSPASPVPTTARAEGSRTRDITSGEPRRAAAPAPGVGQGQGKAGRKGSSPPPGTPSPEGQEASAAAPDRFPATAAAGLVPAWVSAALQPAPATTETPGDTPDGRAPSSGDQNREPDPDTGGSPPVEEPDPTPQVRLVPERSVVSVGDIVRVNVAIDHGRAVSSVPMHVLFDPGMLEFLGAREGSIFRASSQQPLLLAGVNPSYPDDLGIGLALIRSSGLLTGSGTLLMLEFRALQPGRSELRFDGSSLRGPIGEVVPAEFQDSSIEVR